MEISVGNYFCLDSELGGHYDANVLLSICKTLKLEDYMKPSHIDWVNTIDESMVFNTVEYNRYFHIRNIDLDTVSEEEKAEKKEWFSNYLSNSLKPEVIQWLNDNVPDREPYEGYDETKDEKYHLKGWTIGSFEHNLVDTYKMNIFFEREEDAIKFVERWSIFKKPNETYNQDTCEKITMSEEEIKDIEDKIERKG